MEYTLTGIFAFEAILKIIADGFILCGTTSYIRNAWNLIDFIVLIITVRINFLLNI